jgi:hypothetical protein
MLVDLLVELKVDEMVDPLAVLMVDVMDEMKVDLMVDY